MKQLSIAISLILFTATTSYATSDISYCVSCHVDHPTKLDAKHVEYSCATCHISKEGRKQEVASHVPNHWKMLNRDRLVGEEGTKEVCILCHKELVI